MIVSSLFNAKRPEVFVNLERDKSESNLIGNIETKSTLMKLVTNYFDERNFREHNLKLSSKKICVGSKGVAGVFKIIN